MKDLEIYACDSYYFNELNALFVSSICCDLCLIVLTFIVTIFMYILLLSTDVLFCVALIFCYLAVLLLTGFFGCCLPSVVVTPTEVAVPILNKNFMSNG